MKIRQSQWFEVKVAMSGVSDSETPKDKVVAYVVEALSFTEAESRAIEEASAYASGPVEVVNLKKARFSEIFFSDDASDDRWYKTTLQYIVINEKSGKEKLTNVHHLVQASTLKGALTAVENAMKGSMQDYRIAQISETAFMDVFIASAEEDDDDDQQ